MLIKYNKRPKLPWIFFAECRPALFRCKIIFLKLTDVEFINNRTDLK